VNLYVETSSLVAWLLGEEDGRLVGRIVGEARRVQASELTFVEVERLLTRREATGGLPAGRLAEARDRLVATSAAWEVLALGPDILERARRRFPAEPVRTLDALHLASALAGRVLLPDVVFLSLDRRCRANAGALGFRVLPEPAGELREEAGVYAAAGAQARAGRGRPAPRRPRAATVLRARKQRGPARRRGA
jgi:predicted nucleic acid-binding protein